VLLSETTAALVMDDLPEGVSLLDMGKHMLKDLRRAERIRQLVIVGLPAEFPPLKSLEALGSAAAGVQPKHNLPLELTPFIGRDDELVHIGELLQDTSYRLLTLVGVGGIGKTRLALHAAAELVDGYPDGVWLVEFAKLRDPELVSQHAASVLGVSAQEAKEGRDVGDVLAAYLSDKKLLMVLDNCEHLIEASAELAENLLRECPEVQLIATSRENLGIPGEKSYSVPTMEVPPENGGSRDLENIESVRLFIDRAMAVVPDFRVTSGNSAPIVNICRHLDGIPLAIELAAARVKILTPEQIADRLQDRFQLLAGGPRTALPRHQTLQATMEWSYGLLTEPEKSLLMQLSVFSGGWTLEDAEELVQEDLDRRSEILDLLSNLVDKSLVIVKRKHGLARYGMLETVRQFATGKLTASGDADDFNQRHANLFIKLAEEADPRLRSSDQLEWLERLGDEHENLRAAIAWLIDANQSDEAARLIGALGWYWFLGGYWVEAWKSLTKLLDMESEPKPHLKAKVLYRTGGLELIRGSLAGRFELVEEALDICTQISDEEGMAWCLNLLGQASTFSKQDLDEGVSLLSRSIELFRQLDDDWGVAWSTRYIGQIVEIQGDFNQSVQLQKKALEQFEELGDILNSAHSLYLLGGTLRDHGDFDEARQLFQESLSKSIIVEDNFVAAHALHGMGAVALENGDYRDANEHLRNALEIMQRIGDENCASAVFANLSKIAKHSGDFEDATQLQRQSLQGFRGLNRADQIVLGLARLAALEEKMGSEIRAARLLGATDAYLKISQAVLAQVHLEEYEDLMAALQKYKEDEVFSKSYKEGLNLSSDEVIAYALEGIGEV
jgi:non-specific serine/threonine protein kinase